MESDANGITHHRILLNFGVHLAEQESLLRIETLDDTLGSAAGVIGKITSAPESYTLVKLFLIAGLDSGKAPRRHPGTLLYGYAKINRIFRCTESVGINGDVFEVILREKSLYRRCHLVSRKGNLPTLEQSGLSHYL